MNHPSTPGHMPARRSATRPNEQASPGNGPVDPRTAAQPMSRSIQPHPPRPQSKPLQHQQLPPRPAEPHLQPQQQRPEQPHPPQARRSQPNPRS